VSPIENQRVRVGAVELAYDVFGDLERGHPLVLIMGIGAQRLMWDDSLCEQFAAAGFCTVRFDHRDIGESTSLDAPVPDPRRVLMQRIAARLEDTLDALDGLVAHERLEAFRPLAAGGLSVNKRLDRFRHAVGLLRGPFEARNG